MSTGDREKITTAEQLLQLAKDFGRCELVRGELIMLPYNGWEHGVIAGNLLCSVSSFVHEHRLGRAFPGSAGFILEPDQRTVRTADVAFFSAGRLPKGPSRGYIPCPPDLAPEVRSFNDEVPFILAKIAMFLEDGVQVVWDVDPESETITVHRKDCPAETLRSGDTLSEPHLLPGFSMDVSDIFTWD